MSIPEEFSISPMRAALLLAAIGGALVVASLIGLVSTHYLGHGRLLGLVPLFDLDREANIPTLYSTVLLLLCSALLATISLINARKRQSSVQWMILAAIFLFLAVDEFASVHEWLGGRLRELLDSPGPLRVAWVMPYGVLVLILILIFARFAMRLSPRIRNLTASAAVIYLAGAIGFEVIGRWYLESHGRTAVFALFTTVEETFEMLGLVTFVYALLLQISTVESGVIFRIGRRGRPGSDS